jgi:peptidoglycan hydrolase CwlO-like protein
MKITKELILLLIIAGLLIFNMFTMNTVKTDVKKYEDKITSLQVSVDSFVKNNSEINDKITNLNGNVVNITNKIEKVDKTINIIKKNTDEKINRVDSFSINELELFFANRYGKE